MSYCPSQDWDRYVDGLDKAAEAEMVFLKAHRSLIDSIVCAILSNPNVDPMKEKEHDIVERAVSIALQISGRCDDEF